MSAHLWSPIGVDETNPFSGIFDGAGFTISNLIIETPSRSMVGLFGRAINATLKNINLVSASITDEDSVGGLVGNLWQNGVVENCHFTDVNIDATGFNVDGLIGDVVDNGSVSNCSSSGIVNGGSQVGGLIGSPFNGNVISNFYALGQVSADHSVGGFVGATAVGFPGTAGNVFENCYARANVTANLGRAGGFVGGTASLLEINNSYSTGKAIAPEYAGGFVGAGGDFQANNCYWDTESSMHVDGVGGWLGSPGTPNINSKVTSEMKVQAMADLLNDGDASGPWMLDANINDGYPSFEGTGLSVDQFYAEENTLTVFPNIFNATLNIESEKDLIDYSIYDLSGKQMQFSELNGKQAQIATQKLPSGMYLIKVTTTQGVISKNIVK